MLRLSLTIILTVIILHWLSGHVITVNMVVEVSQTPAKKERRYHHGDLRAALMQAADEALERDGAEALSFRAIARAAGVSQTAPYNHFANREALLAALAERGFVALGRSQAEAAAREHEPEARVVAAGLDYIAFARRRPQLYRLMFGVGLPDWHERPAVAGAKWRSIQPLRSLLADWGAARSWDADRIDATAIAAWSMVHGLAMLRIDRAFIQFGEAMPADTIERHALSGLVAGWR